MLTIVSCGEPLINQEGRFAQEMEADASTVGIDNAPDIMFHCMDRETQLTDIIT